MDKPLPALPDHRKLVTLTRQARAHLHRFVERGLEEGLWLSDEFKAAWTDAIIDALDELGASFARGTWLEGVRRASQTNRRDIPRPPERKTPVHPPSESVSPGATTASGADNQTGPLPFPIPENDDDESILDDIRSALAVPIPPGSTPRFKHLLLLVSPWGSQVVPTEDSGFHLVSPTVGCLFTPNLFPLSSLGLESVMYGIRRFPDVPKPVKFVGGTFTFKGVVSAAHHRLLRKTLRLAIYVFLSILLEQHLLSDSGVTLQYPPPRLSSPPVSAVPSLSRHLSQDSSRRGRHQHSRSLIPSGLFSIFSKRSSQASQGSTGGPSPPRGSMELDRPHRPSLTEDSRLRRFSFITDATRPLFSSPKPEPPPARPLFITTLEKVGGSLPILSTSPDVSFPPCPLLVYLAEKEKKDAKRRLTGDEKAAMNSVLGWAGREDAGSSMSGIIGFVRHQEISVLVSAHPTAIPDTTSPDEGAAGPCQKPAWQTLRYYAYYGHEGTDVSLGDTIIEFAEKAQEECEKSECKAKRWQHELRYIHNDLRLVITFDSPSEEKKDTEKEKQAQATPLIIFWQSCLECGEHTEKRAITDGTYLVSFGKFLELLFYSPSLQAIIPPLCAHTSTPRHEARYKIRRHFLYEDTTVHLALDPLSDVFELRVPRIQILRGSSDKTNMMIRDRSNSDIGRYPSLEEQKTHIRKEILNWFHALAQHLDKLEDSCTSSLDGFSHNSSRKSLPRLPSQDDSELSDDSDAESEVDPSNCKSTPRAAVSGLPLASPTRGPLSPSIPNSSSEDYFSSATSPHALTRSYSDPDTLPTPRPSHFHQPTSVPATPLPQVSSTPKPLPPVLSKPLPHGPVSTDPADSLRLLSNMRRTFQQAEQKLYAQLSQTSDANLINDVRRTFQTSGLATMKRLQAWQKKHMSGRKGLDENWAKDVEPEWWARGYHAVPGGNVIIKEDDWGSIIAFTLGTSDYQRELSSLSVPRSASPAPATPHSPAASERTSFFGLPSAQRFKFGFGSTGPDPDQDDVEWHQPEGFSAVISRKTHPRDPSALLSLRDVLRQKNLATTEGSGGLLPSPRFASLGLPGGRNISGAGTPRSAWAKPAPVEVNTEAATGGVIMGLPERGVSPSPSTGRQGAAGLFSMSESAAGKKLHELENASSSLLLGSDAASTNGSLGSVHAQARRRKASSIISVESDATIGKESTASVVLDAAEHEDETSDQPARLSTPPPNVPPKDAASRVSPPPSPSFAQSEDTTSQSSFASLTSSIANVMKMVLNNDVNARPTSPSPHHHALLSSVEPHSTIDERPHIKYDWTIGKRLKFSCTVYYAKQFDSLRRRCGVDEVYLKSLSMSTNWAAEGGKSKSNFWKTADERFIIKTLVNAWNVADLQVLLELAPSYFRYLDSTSGKSTVLAKLLGFYTIEIRNLETGAVQSKADLLVMENLFYEQDIVKTFDLKGIPGRKVKSGPESSSTLFDGEWMEGQQKTLTLIRPHSKLVLQEAIKNDAEFLARSNIMDYSLLLGLDESRKQIACGLVDTIGSYTFAKTLEYKAKQGLNSGKEVTVVPPAEYQERFVNALDGYFVACPDKWSKSLEGWDYSDVESLPSVL